MLDEVDSTQRIASQLETDICFAHHQTKGRGRFGREWQSEKSGSLTFSVAFHGEVGHAKPWLIGMAVALAASKEIDCGLQWPNDLVFDNKKVGGVLTELVSSPKGLVPVVGIGINLGQVSFPRELEHIATSVWIENGNEREPIEVARAILERIREQPTPKDWFDIWPHWQRRDQTPGKLYKTMQGFVAEALGIGTEGELIAYGNGQQLSILAADAIFGNQVEG